MFLPSVAMPDLLAIREKMLAAIRRGLIADATGVSQEESVEFNAANYMHVSARVARRFPELRESRMVLGYHTVAPRERFGVSGMEHDASDMLRRIYIQVVSAVLGVSFAFLHLPPALQDEVLESAAMSLFGICMVGFSRLWAVSPAVAIASIVVLIVLLHLWLTSNSVRNNKLLQQNKLKMRLAGAAALQDATKEKNLNGVEKPLVLGPDSVQLQLHGHGHGPSPGHLPGRRLQALEDQWKHGDCDVDGDSVGNKSGTPASAEGIDGLGLDEGEEEVPGPSGRREGRLGAAVVAAVADLIRDDFADVEAEILARDKGRKQMLEGMRLQSFSSMRYGSDAPSDASSRHVGGSDEGSDEWVDSDESSSDGAADEFGSDDESENDSVWSGSGSGLGSGSGSGLGEGDSVSLSLDVDMDVGVDLSSDREESNRSSGCIDIDSSNGNSNSSKSSKSSKSSGSCNHSANVRIHVPARSYPECVTAAASPSRPTSAMSPVATPPRNATGRGLGVPVAPVSPMPPNTSASAGASANPNANPNADDAGVDTFADIEAGIVNNVGTAAVEWGTIAPIGDYNSNANSESESEFEFEGGDNEDWGWEGDDSSDSDSDSQGDSAV